MQLERVGFVTVTGGRLEYRWLPPQCEHLPTLVLLHEGLGCVTLWKDFPDRLARITGCGVFVYSRFGYGRSDPATLPRPLTYMHEEGLTVLPELLEVLGFDRVILVGHSDGASISLIHAGGTPAERVLGLVLMAPHVFNEPCCVASIEAARRAYEDGDLRERLSLYHAHVDVAFRGWNQAWLDPGFLDWNLESYLPGIAVPTLVIQGQQDEYGSERQVTTIQDACNAPVQLELLDDCRHSPHRDQPDVTLDLVGRLVASISRSCA